MSSRIEAVSGHLSGKNPNDVVIVSAVRTAITKGGKGGFKVLQPFLSQGNTS